MKKWIEASIEVIEFSFTENQPTKDFAADGIINGELVRGKRDGSGPVTSVPYYPQ